MRWILLAALAACGSKAGDAASCKAQVDELMTFLQAMDHSPSIFYVKDLQLVMRPELPAREETYAPSIMILPDAMLLMGTPVTFEELPIALQGERDRRNMRVEPDPSRRVDPARIYLAIDARTSWDRVGRVAREAALAGFTSVGFVFGRPSPVKPPPRSWVDDKLDAIANDEVSSKATRVAKLASDIVQSCPAMNRVFGSVAMVDDKAKAIIDGTGPALIACNCHVDIPALRSVMWRVAGNPNPTTTLDVTLSNEAAALDLPDTTPWSEASTHIKPGATLWPVHPIPRPPLPKHR